jgi:hypothetical protein
MHSAWHSTKYDLDNMDWNEIREIYLPEIQMSWGSACEAMRKSWFSYKMSKREGDRGWDIILRINRIQKALGIELTEFRDGPDIEWVRTQLDLEEGTGVEPTSEDLELKFEEDHVESEDTWDNSVMSETSKIEGEDALYAQLRREERSEALADVGIYESESKEEKNEW